MNEDTQQKYLELQMLDSELKQLQQQLINADKQLEELRKLEDALTEFSKVKPGTETLSAIGNGIFAKTEIKNTKEVIMAVGANISVEKPTADAIAIVKDQTKKTEEVIEQLEKSLGQAATNIQLLQNEFEAESQKQGK